MITQLDKHLNDHFDTRDLRPRTTPNRSKTTGDKSHQTLRRSDLLLNLAFNLSKGHYNFVSELLKSKLGKQGTIDLNIDETVKFEHLKFETNNLSKKFLLGKNPLILCNYLKENDWALSLSQLLVQNGANISQRDHCNGCSSLHYACALLKTGIIEFLLRNINQNLNYLIDNNGNSPIFYLLASYGCLDHEKQTVLEEKILNALKIYLNYLKHYNFKINIRNRNGLSLYGLWEFFTINNKFLLENSVFKKSLESILEENPALRKLDKYKSLIDLKPETDYYTLSSRTCIEIFLKRHFLIDFKNFKFVQHSAKIDNYLMLLFLDKVTPNYLPINFCLIRDESGSEKNVEIYRKNIHIPMSCDQHYFKSSNEKKNLIQSDLNWRHKFSQLFSSVEIKNSESYRASAKCLIETPKVEQSIRISPHHNCHQHQHPNQSNHSQHVHEVSHVNHKSDPGNSRKHKFHSLHRK